MSPSCHLARMSGSFCGRPAFIGKSVLGRKTVWRQSGFAAVSGLSDIWRGLSGRLAACKPGASLLGRAAAGQALVRGVLLRLGPDVAVRAERRSDGPDILDPDIALEG